MSTTSLELRGINPKFLEDGTDQRDLYYRPALISLPPSWFPTSLRLGADKSLVKIRDQKATGRCTGFALANLIDLLRAYETANGAGDESLPPVSARMLFEMGKLVSSVGTGAEEQRLSIRSTIKGLYHNGVCLEGEWPDDQELSHLSVDCAKSARRISLGAYYRLEQLLSDYHCALREADGILVSARIHSGWSNELVARNGRIVQTGGDHGAHAFLIIGYDEEGFYVLNSWGNNWGGEVHGATVPGVAKWTYKDWAENVMDAWVLRLAVSTPGSFDYTLGPQGINYLGGPNWKSDASNSHEQMPPRFFEQYSIPRLHVLGHYVHYGNGDFVKGGSYPDDAESLSTTLNYVSSKISDDTHKSNRDRNINTIYLRLTGDTGSVDDAMHRVALLRRRLRPHGIYPLSVIWTASLASAFNVAIRSCMKTATDRMPYPSDERNDLIETLVRPIGRPLWEQLQTEAQLVAGENGPFQRILTELNHALDNRRYHDVDVDDEWDYPHIELVVEGAGALVLIAMLEETGTSALHLLRHVRNIRLAYPMVRYQKIYNAILNCIRFRDARSFDFVSRFSLITPHQSFIDNATVGPYTRSWFHLVNNSFDAETIGDREENIASLAPESLNAMFDSEFFKVSHISKGGEMSRRENGSALLRRFLVGDEFLNLIFPNRVT